MGVPFRIGLLQLSKEPVKDLVHLAQVCDEQGFDTFWIAEAYHWWRMAGGEARSSTAISALIAQATRRIGLGWGIISPYTRHPLQIAMEARVVQEAAGPDRFLLGLGASKIFMKHIGTETSHAGGPATTLREAIQIVRSAMEGGAFAFTGKVFQAAVPGLLAEALSPRGTVPIYLAGTGVSMQKLAGECADGLLTASITTPAFVRYARKNLEEGARKAGRDASTLDLGCVVVASIGEDPDTAQNGAREVAAVYLANKVHNIGGAAGVLLEMAGLTFEDITPIAQAMESGGVKAATRALTDEVLEKVRPVAGTPRQCIERIEEYRDAGCTHLLLELGGEDRPRQARLFGQQVLSHFKEHEGA